MIPLAAVDGAAAVVFGLVYAAAGARFLTQAAFVAALVVFFGALTALWLRVEKSPRAARHPLQRVGRIAGALLLCLIALPGLALMPLFVLKEGLPAEAGIDDVIRPVMVLLLVSLALTVLVNVVGICILVGAGVLRSSRRPSG